MKHQGHKKGIGTFTEGELVQAEILESIQDFVGNSNQEVATKILDWSIISTLNRTGAVLGNNYECGSSIENILGQRP